MAKATSHLCAKQKPGGNGAHLWARMRSVFGKFRPQVEAGADKYSQFDVCYETLCFTKDWARETTLWKDRYCCTCEVVLWAADGGFYNYKSRMEELTVLCISLFFCLFQGTWMRGLWCCRSCFITARGSLR